MGDGLPASVPPEVIKRVSGKQAPPAPHRQRLLVASVKEAKAEAKGKQDPSTGPEPKAKAKSKAKAKTTKRDPEKPREKTPYAEAKDKFIAKFLDCAYFKSLLRFPQL